MKLKSKLYLPVQLLFLIIIVGGFTFPKDKITFEKIEGFSNEVNKKLEKFFQTTENYNGRKIAVFDGDGTVLGQVPNYLADECLYDFANKNPQRKKELIELMKTQSNVSMEYVQNRVRFMSGDSLSYWRRLGAEHFKKYYSDNEN